jgi:hypothetical protein
VDEKSELDRLLDAGKEAAEIAVAISQAESKRRRRRDDKARAVRRK